MGRINQVWVYVCVRRCVCVCVCECWQLITLMHWSLRELASLESPPPTSLFTPPLPALASPTYIAQSRTLAYPHTQTHAPTRTYTHSNQQACHLQRTTWQNSMSCALGWIFWNNAFWGRRVCVWGRSAGHWDVARTKLSFSCCDFISTAQEDQTPANTFPRCVAL